MAVDTLFKWRDGNRREVEKKNSTISHFTFPVKIAFTLYHMHNWLENFVLVEIEINNSVCEVSWLCVNFMYVCIISCALAVFDFVWLWTYRSEKKLITSFSKVYKAWRRATSFLQRNSERISEREFASWQYFSETSCGKFQGNIIWRKFYYQMNPFFLCKFTSSRTEQFFFDWTNNWLRHIRFWSC